MSNQGVNSRYASLEVDVGFRSVMSQTHDLASFAWQVQDSAHGGVEMANGGHKV